MKKTFILKGYQPTYGKSSKNFKPPQSGTAAKKPQDHPTALHEQIDIDRKNLNS